MKVLQIGKYYPPYMGGIETHLQALCGALRNVVDVRVLVANDANKEVIEDVDGVRVIRLATQFCFASSPICLTMAHRIRQEQPDLVHVHLPNPIAVLAVLASGYSGPIIATYHSDTVKQVVLGRLFEPLLQRFLRRAEAIIVTSPNYLETSSTLAPHRSRCRVIPYGINTEQFAACDSAEVMAIQSRLGERLILAVGRLVYYKGFEYLIDAMPNVNGRLLLVGDGPLRGALEQRAASNGVADRITFLGGMQNEQVIPYYHAAELFVLPSIARSEAFGIVQIEAMAAGRPVINTSLDSGVPFVSQHRVSGFTVPPKDPAALAASINHLLDDDALRASLGRGARERANREFSVESMATRVLDVYDCVAGTASRPVLVAAAR